MDRIIGKTVGGTYRVVRPIGRGGMASVYEAVDERNGRTVALKLLAGTASGPTHTERFRREVQAVARLDHPAIVKVLDSGLHEGRYYYVMEYVAGWPLSRVLARLRTGDLPEPGLAGAVSALGGSAPASGRLADTQADTVPPRSAAELDSREADVASASAYARGEPDGRPGAGRSHVPPSRERRRYVDEMCWIALAAAQALAHAHARGVVHRDVKPDNLLLDHEGHVHISDFGLASVAEEDTRGRLTVAGELLGTPLYMSPEQIAAGRVPIDQRTDVYSLGATLYEMLALHPPHAASTREALLQAVAVKETPPLGSRNAAVPPALQAVVHHAMEKDPDRRYQTMNDLADDLKRFLNGEGVSVQMVGPLRRAWRRQSVTVRATVAVLLAAVTLVVGVAYLADRDRGDGIASPIQRAEFVDRARDAALAEDWARALMCYARAVPVEPRDVVAMEMEFAIQRVLPPVARLPYFGPGPRFAVSGSGATTAVCNGPHSALIVPAVGRIGNPIAVSHGVDDLIEEVRFTASGEQLLTLGTRELRCWQSGGSLLATWTIPSDRLVTAFQVDQNGRWLLVRSATAEGTEPGDAATLWRRDEVEPQWQPIADFGPVVDASLRMEGDAAAVVQRTGKASVILLDREREHPVYLPMSRMIPYWRIWCPQGTTRLITLDAEGRWESHERPPGGTEFASHTIRQSDVPLAPSARDRAFVRSMAGGRRLLTGAPVRDGERTRFDLRVHLAGDLSSVGEPMPAESVWVSPMADRFVIARGRVLEVCEVESGHVVAHLTLPGDDSDGDPPPRRRAMPSAPGERRIMVGDWEGFHATDPLVPCPWVSVDLPGRTVLRMDTVADGHLVHVWDVDAGTVITRWRSSDPALTWASLHPSGRWVWLGYRDGHIVVRDLDAVRQPFAGGLIEGTEARLTAAAVDRDSYGIAVVAEEARRGRTVLKARRIAEAPMATGSSWETEGDGRVCTAISPKGDRLALCDDDGRCVIVTNGDSERAVVGVNAAIDAFAFDRERGDSSNRPVALAGTRAGELLIIGLEDGIPARRIAPGLRRVVAIDRDEQTVVALDERMHCALVHVGEDTLPRTESRTDVPEPFSQLSGRAVVYDLSDAFPSGTEDGAPGESATADVGHRDSRDTLVALTGTRSPDLFLLAVCRAEEIGLWMLKRPAFGQAQGWAQRFGGPLKIAPPVPDRGRAARPARPIVGLAFLATPDGGLELIAVRCDGIVKRWGVFAPPVPVDATISADEIWRLRIRSWLGREWDIKTGRVQPLRHVVWDATRAEFDPARP